MDLKAAFESLKPSGRFDAACKRCGGSGMVYVARPYYIGTRYCGDIDEYVPCPDCAEPVCPVCGGRGVITKAVEASHPDFGRMFECPACAAGQAARLYAQKMAFRRAELPDAYRSLTFETFDALPYELRDGKLLARVACELFAARVEDGCFFTLSEAHALVGRTLDGDDSRRNSIVLQGPVGVGKTGLAAAAMNALLATGRTALYARTRDLISEVQRRYGGQNDGGLSAEAALHKAKTAPILILDEFSLHNITPDRREIVEELMRYRYGERLPTILTLNADRDEMEYEWGLRTATVVRAMAHWFVLSGFPLRDEGWAVES